jgi:hypothetical protein
MRRKWFLAGLLAASVSVLGGVGGTPAAAAKAPDRVVEFHGYRVAIPAGWPVFDLSADPSVCVRFNRHALYLGSPSPVARCPARAIGRTEAILIQPLGGSGPWANRPLASDRSATSFVAASGKVAVTATWSRHRSTVRRALPRRSLSRGRPAAPGPAILHERTPVASPSARAAAFTGLGFDACAAPSAAAMTAWSSSPYRAVGIYIGGENRACAQANLSAAWVRDRVAAGWHLVPTYVGVQAPGACGCTTIDPDNAAAQGTAAAKAAAGQAGDLGIPEGNPIYYDMEHYSRGTPMVLAFLSAWTSQLHALGYVSGVYSSASSGISDLVDANGAPGMVEPDAIWIANWNGKRTTDDPYVPDELWANQQRLHQYEGGHNETHGGVTINIDGNYLDGPTADTSGATAPPPFSPPTECVVPRLRGLSLGRARRELRRAHCGLGTVRRPRHRVRHRVLRITRQRPRAGTRLAHLSSVNVVLKWRRR